MSLRYGKAFRRGMRKVLFERQGRRCCYCDRAVYLDWDHGTQTATLEHLRKLSNGGSDHPDNLAVACARCNSSRGDLSWVEFATLMRPKAANANAVYLPNQIPILAGEARIAHLGEVNQ